MTMHSPILLFLICALLGCSESDPVTLAFRMAESEAAPGLTEMVTASGEHLFLHDTVVLDEADVHSAEVSTFEGVVAIEVVLTAEGGRRFEEWTEMHVGKQCGIVVNGELMSAPRINAPIRGGRALITGAFTEAEARRIASALSGK